jgi:hypothetical protein
MAKIPSIPTVPLARRWLRKIKCIVKVAGDKQVDIGETTMSIGKAAYHAARILSAVGEEAKALNDMITRQINEKFIAAGGKFRAGPWGGGTSTQRPFSARWFEIQILSVSGASASSVLPGTVSLIFNFYTPGNPTETEQQALLFVCWVPRVPGTNDRWAAESFAANELAKCVRHVSGLVGYEAELSNQSVREEEWAYAVPLDKLRVPGAAEILIVDPVVALLSGTPPMEALATIQKEIVRFGRPSVNV